MGKKDQLSITLIEMSEFVPCFSLQYCILHIFFPKLFHIFKYIIQNPIKIHNLSFMLVFWVKLTELLVSLLLTVNEFTPLFLCYYSYFKQVNINWIWTFSETTLTTLTNLLHFFCKTKFRQNSFCNVANNKQNWKVS